MPSSLPKSARPLPDRVVDGLYLGNAWQATELPALQQLGITHIVNVTVERPNAHPDAFLYLTIPVHDSPAQPLFHYFSRAAGFIEQALAAGGAVLVHCQMSVSRSPAVVLAYLMISRRIGLEAAYDLLLSALPAHHHIQPNDGFLLQLRKLELRLTGGLRMSRRLTESDSCCVPPALTPAEHFCDEVAQLTTTAALTCEVDAIAAVATAAAVGLQSREQLMGAVWLSLRQTLAAFTGGSWRDLKARRAVSAVLVWLIDAGRLSAAEVAAAVHRVADDDELLQEIPKPLVARLAPEVVTEVNSCVQCARGQKDAAIGIGSAASEVIEAVNS